MKTRDEKMEEVADALDNGAPLSDDDIRRLIESTMSDLEFTFKLRLKALVNEGIAEGDLKFTTKHRKLVDCMYEAYFIDGPIDTEELFKDCPTPREMIAKMVNMTEKDLFRIGYNKNTPFVIKKYVEFIMNGDLDGLNAILTQALGKPVERRLSLSARVNPLAHLTTEEIRAMLESGKE